MSKHRQCQTQLQTTCIVNQTIFSEPCTYKTIENHYYKQSTFLNKFGYANAQNIHKIDKMRFIKAIQRKSTNYLSYLIGLVVTRLRKLFRTCRNRFPGLQHAISIQSWWNGRSFTPEKLIFCSMDRRRVDLISPDPTDSYEHGNFPISDFQADRM